ncbi:hypothetical protein [Pseudomonas eucalypticola]|uniref:Uncharacterized protein n=1 Tax=Pseudomonas eucalypticola TaxID=2599595 RepID=A0A7D5D5M3_9PSED|nr:hypothetical protein [Pseudomonas eucalypticola]QKZ03819.1 hypothetical protein HWQ56_08500 [Pseudomonas eucalypticola]
MGTPSQVFEYQGTFKFTVANHTYYADRIFFAKEGAQWDIVGLFGRDTELRCVFLTFHGGGFGSYRIQDPAAGEDPTTARYIAGGNHSSASGGQLDVWLEDDGQGGGDFHFSGAGPNEVVGNFTLLGPPAEVLDQEVRALFER